MNAIHKDLFSGDIRIALKTAEGILKGSPASVAAFARLTRGLRKAERRRAKYAENGVVVYALALCRITLCLFPQNDWFSATAPPNWGIYRNIPFVILGGMIAYELFMGRNTVKGFGFAWLAVTLSFLFYIPVVLFADTNPIIGMLMLPKTVCYVWLVVMGYRGTQ